MEVNIIDDAERMLTLHFNITMQIKSANHKDAFFSSLVGYRTRKSYSWLVRQKRQDKFFRSFFFLKEINTFIPQGRNKRIYNVTKISI